MKLLFITFFSLVLLCFTEARVYQIIDQFGDSPPPLVVLVSNGGDTTPPYDWFSPYYGYGGGSGGPPGFQFRTTAAALGGQRDTILGYESASPTNSVAILTVVGDAASIAFPLNYAGGAYYQWDGDDTGGSGTAFPGARLNISPGIGQGVPFANGDGSIDFTFGGQAAGIYISVKSDHDVNYFLDAIDSNSVINTQAFLVEISGSNADDEIPYYFRYDNTNWSNRATFDWTRVRAFQVRVFTFNDVESGGTQQAVDTEFRLLRVVGYQISGNVATDCLCDGTFEQRNQNVQVDLFVTGSPTALVSEFTDINGDYVFADSRITDGSYTVCLNDRTSPRCPSSPACRTVTILPFTNAAVADITNVDFVFTTTTSLVVPPDTTIECGTCSTPTCTGFGQATGCTGTPTQINTWTDVVTPPSGIGCTVTIRRTWVDTDSGARGTQTITILDRTAPVLTAPAVSRTLDCSAPSTYANFISTRGGATATDCNSITWTPSANTAPVRCDDETVTFTASDPCGFSVRTTATYTVVDNVAPVFAPGASNASAACNLKTGSSTTALNNWIASRGGSTVTDNCATSGQLTNTNNFTGLTAGCNAATTVTFTTSDGCGNSASTTASFTITDTTAPVISPAAAAGSSPCSSSGSDNTAFQTWLSNRAGARATDDCIANDANLTWTNDFVGGTVGGSGTCTQAIPVTFTVTDACGLSSRTTATYTISDTSMPTITTQAVSQNAQCDGTGNSGDFATWVNDNGGARATDNCNAVVWSNNAGTNPVTCGQSTSVTFSVSDSCGNGPRTTTASFTIVDTVAPTFVTNPQSATVECSSTATAQFNTWLSTSGGATVSDNCSTTGNTIINNFTGTPLAPGCNNAATVRFNARDSCGNLSAPQTAVFTITDTIAPVITAQAQSTSVECNLGTNNQSYQTFVSTRGGATATDSCAASVSWSNNAPASFTGNCNVGQTVTFTASDGCGNSVPTTATFSVTDTTTPTLVTPATDRTVECNGSGNTNDVNTFLSTRGGAAATDNCGSVTWTNDFVALSGGCTSSARVTFTGCDPCSLCVATTATFTVTDTRGPTINPQAQARSVECNPNSNDNQFDDWVADNGGARATDLCNQSGLVWTHNAVASPFSCDSEQITFTVTDPCGFSASTTAIFTIVDSVRPVISPGASPATVECNGTGNTVDYASYVASNGGATATDVCAFSLTWTNNAAPAGPVGCGSQNIVFTVMDECNNAATTTGSFTVRDTAGPTITSPAQARSVECSDSATNTATVNTWLAERGGATAIDSCYGSNLTWTNNFTALQSDGCNRFADVVFRVTDPCAQFSTTSARFTIVDTTRPTITTVAADAVFECDRTSNTSEVNTYVSSRGGATATDICSNVVWSNNFVAAPEECAGPISISFTATDACGNSATTVGSIEIQDNAPPSFPTFPVNVRLGCDQDIHPDTAGYPTVFDACATSPSLTWSDVQFKEPDEGFCPGDLITYRTWLTVDDCGNTHTQEQVVTTVYARSSGPCTPTECPPCVLDQCCEVVPNQVACNPVPCNEVACVTTPCEAVPCIPNIECQDPIDGGDGGVGPAPVASATPQPSCEPVYIYVFDDDDTNVDGGDNNPIIQPRETASSASALVASFALIVIAVLSILI